MNKITSIILSTIAATVGAAMIFIIIKKQKKTRMTKLHCGQYTVDMFRKITKDLNRAIANTERRLAKHDKLQKLYEQMQWLP